MLGSPQAKLMTITPAMAKEWLKSNTNNRGLQERYVTKLVRDIKNNEWSLNHQGIAFGTDGTLYDGQHRLTAIVQANQAISTFVFFNVQRDGIDLGKIRSVADSLTLKAEYGKVTGKQIATLNMMLKGLGNPRSRTVEEQGKLLIKHQEAIDFAIKEIKCSPGDIPGIATSSTRGVIARAYYSADHNKLREFCSMLSIGIFQRKGCPVRLLFMWLIRSKKERNQSIRSRYGKTERALQAFLNNENLSVLRTNTKELFPLSKEEEKGITCPTT